MIPLAAIEGKMIFVTVMVIVGIINALLEKKKKDATGGMNSPAPRPQGGTGGSKSADEEERLRRFFEALGIPQQPGQKPAQQQQPTPKPVQQPAQRAVTRLQERRTQVAKPAPKPKPSLIAPQPEMARAGRIEEAASSIEKISGEFQAMNVRVEMPRVRPLERPARLAYANAGTTTVLDHDANPLVASLRRTLTNPTDIRAAFLAAELLGKPKGLQG